MAFVVDTVGEITFPDGTTGKGVVLAVPFEMDEEGARELMRQTARLWSDRVLLISAQSPRREAS